MYGITEYDGFIARRRRRTRKECPQTMRKEIKIIVELLSDYNLMEKDFYIK